MTAEEATSRTGPVSTAKRNSCQENQDIITNKSARKSELLKRDKGTKYQYKNKARKKSKDRPPRHPHPTHKNKTNTINTHISGAHKATSPDVLRAEGKSGASRG